MKNKIVSFLLIVFFFSISTGESFSQDTNNVLIEYQTGTWCSVCPCGDMIVDSILVDYPNSIVLAYHGGSSDPWYIYSEGIRALLALGPYPRATIGRRTGSISRSAWYDSVVSQTTLSPNVSIDIVKSYNPVTRLLTATANVTALDTVNETYAINFVLIEGNLIYPQTGNSSCPGGPNYVHHHVVKAMINGDIGDTLNAVIPWIQGTNISKNINYIIDTAFVPQNCHLVVFVYRPHLFFSTMSYIQQAEQVEVESSTGITNSGINVMSYSLSQNYPNPFNPKTNIHFSIPEDGKVILKFYDVLGNEIVTFNNEFLNAGIYNVEFDGSDLSSGVYFYKLEARDFVSTKKMLLIK